jgi:hypothetical protein
MTTYIDLTPTWEQILPALLAILENGSAEGKKIARDELRRMAQAADQWNAAAKANDQVSVLGG